MSYTSSQRHAFTLLTLVNTGVVAWIVAAGVQAWWLVLYAALLPVVFRLLILASEQADPFRIVAALRLRRAMRRGEIVLHYQPKVTVGDGRIIGVEALARWDSPDRGLLLPGEWIQAAAHRSVRWAFTEHVLREAIEQTARWCSAGLGLVVCVNVSPDVFADPRLVPELERLLRLHDVPPAHLCVELTEEALERSEEALAVARQLHDLGIVLALDDFGIGHSSMERLVGLPVREVKIDRRFVACMTESDRHRAVVVATTQLAHTLGLGVVAEGVEDTGTLDALQAVGCTVAQGFLFSRAVPVEELELAAREGRFSRPAARGGAGSAGAAEPSAATSGSR